ncbi:MAG: carboxylesterase family protein [Oscillospiraceae bacterium]|nr:carboxylesterase family protein [Oscillospiraceae bacterium]
MEHKRKPNGYVRLDTPCGKIKGLRKEDHLLFEGVPFARAERWEDPVVVDHWEGELDATKFGPLCSQHAQFYSELQGFSKFYYNENAEKRVCAYSETEGLNLNIWAPEGGHDLPVAVFIHGGSFVSGGNSNINICGGAEYCRRGIIMVTVNYRLNAFATGYDDTHKGNYAIKDQVAALKWVRNNIAAFGGDPDHIVVMGESAGALSLQLLLYCPQARGLMKGAVLMSGGGSFERLGTPARPEISRTVWNMVMKKYGVTSLDQLKDLPAKEVYDAWMEAGMTDINLANHYAKPILDGEWIPGTFAELVADDAIEDIPCIIGMSAQDMFPFYLYTCAVEWAAYHAKHGRKPVYGYYLDRRLPGGDDAGSYHGADLWYAFGTLDGNWRPFEETDYRISENMIDYLAGFIKTGVPAAEGLAEWKPMTDTATQFLRFGEELPEMYQPPVDALVSDIRNTLKPFPGM